MRGFRNNMVFEDHLVNTMCDNIISLALENSVLDTAVMFTGLASYFHQRGADARPLKNIIFKTTDVNVYNAFLMRVNELGVLNILKFNNRVLFEYQGSFQLALFEFWLDIDSTETVDLNGVICEKYDHIKEVLL